MQSILTTEQRNPRSAEVDTLTALEIVQLINSEDARVAQAVANEAAAIAQAVERIAECFRDGGRLFYLGAGTSGRLGVLDASECPPTFSTPAEMVVGIIAGGPSALTQAIEGAEDNRDQAALDLAGRNFSAKDVLVGIATSGSTPYVLGGLEYARSLGATSVGIACNQEAALGPLSDIRITPIVGPEVISGSTRMKAGTATKMVLNILTTGAMILIGKTYGNLMVDLRASNSKLKARSIRIVSEVTGQSVADSERVLNACDGEVKTAITSAMLNLDATTARARLAEAQGRLKDALKSDRHHE